ncbi:hypothetical protein [Oerskovia enterophila]|uniref:hypothetical protein n=1 Tax=Oerskovia enterophila TaxID=43678 RepID=UPI003396AAA2
MSQQTGRPRPASQDGSGLRDSRHGRAPSSAVYARRRLVALGVLLALLAGVVGFAALVWPGFARAGEAEAPAEVTVTEAPPTPTIEPVERSASTEFAEVLPDTVLQFALRSEALTDAYGDAGAIEGHELTYADSEGDAASTVTVLAGQWGDGDEAEVAYDELLEAAVAAGGEPTTTGDVEVDGKPVGTYAVTPVAAAAGTATVTWRNGTAVLQATGPVDQIEKFYTAFPL